jgi:hypothetical protein
MNYFVGRDDLQGVRQKSDVKTLGSSPLIRTTLSEVLKSAA